MRLQNPEAVRWQAKRQPTTSDFGGERERESTSEGRDWSLPSAADIRVNQGGIRERRRGVAGWREVLPFLSVYRISKEEKIVTSTLRVH